MCLVHVRKPKCYITRNFCMRLTSLGNTNWQFQIISELISVSRRVIYEFAKDINYICRENPLASCEFSDSLLPNAAGISKILEVK